MNKVFLIGNLTRDPELSETPSGVSVCKFDIAVNRNFTNANGERECDFLKIVTWRALAENCGNYLSKGKKVSVAGSIQTRSYNDSNGDKRYVTEIIANEVEFLSPREDGESRQQPARGNGGTDRRGGGQTRRRPALQEFDDDGDIPF